MFKQYQKMDLEHAQQLLSRKGVKIPFPLTAARNFNQSEGDPNGLWDGLWRRVVVVVVGVRGGQKMQL